MFYCPNTDYYSFKRAEEIFCHDSTIYFFKRTEELLQDGYNPLMELIYHKPKWYQFKQERIIKKYIKFLRKDYTPSFEFLCAIYDFVRFLEISYMYPNVKESIIYAYNNLKKDIKSFMIPRSSSIMDPSISSMDAAQYNIEYTLYPDEYRICITIRRDWGDRIKTEISFIAREPMNLSISDQVLFNLVTSDTMDALTTLFMVVYDNISHLTYRDDTGDKDLFKHQN